MFGSQKKSSHIVLYCDEKSIRYIVVDKDDKGFFVVLHDEALLPEGIIHKAEVLQAEAFVGILKNILKNIEKHVSSSRGMKTSLLLHNDHFVNKSFDFHNYHPRKNFLEELKRFMSEQSSEFKWLEDHRYLPSYDSETQRVYIHALSNTLHDSYEILMEKAGFKNVSITSDLYATEQLLKENETAQVIIFGENNSRVVEYRDGHYISDQKFQVSYQQFASDIIKNLNIQEDTARKIVREYGVSRAHKDQKVFSRISRSMTPLLDYLRKKKTVQNIPIYVLYLDAPIPGMSDVLEKRLSVDVKELDPLNADAYDVHEVLSLHRDDSYRYSLLLNHAMAEYDS